MTQTVQGEILLVPYRTSLKLPFFSCENLELKYIFKFLLSLFTAIHKPHYWFVAIVRQTALDSLHYRQNVNFHICSRSFYCYLKHCNLKLLELLLKLTGFTLFFLCKPILFCICRDFQLLLSHRLNFLLLYFVP